MLKANLCQYFVLNTLLSNVFEYGVRQKRSFSKLFCSFLERTEKTKEVGPISYNRIMQADCF